MKAAAVSFALCLFAFASYADEVDVKDILSGETMNVAFVVENESCPAAASTVAYQARVSAYRIPPRRGVNVDQWAFGPLPDGGSLKMTCADSGSAIEVTVGKTTKSANYGDKPWQVKR
ncbi:MAG: hypothetical protein F4Y86_08385 [Gammaproteobacteria bacterium]|nr:hypothetical protein [Gammaproteobacteria bacterium]